MKARANVHAGDRSSRASSDGIRKVDFLGEHMI